MKIAIIGGGWAGIAAAVELAEHATSARITLFEAGRRLGGRARMADFANPQKLDNGQHILLGAYRETLALMTRVGVSPTQKLQRLPLQIRDTQGFRLSLPSSTLLPAPFKLVWGLLAARGVRLTEKIACALWAQRLKRQRFRLEQDCSVAAWLDRAGQTGTLRHRLWEPLCLAALNTPVDRASARVFAHVLQDSLGSPESGATDLLLPRTALSELLPDPAQKWLSSQGVDIRLRHRAHTLRLQGRQFLLDNIAFDRVIIAVAPQHLSPLLALLPALANFPLPPTTFEPIGTLYLTYPATVSLPFPLMAFDGQWLVDRGNGVLAAIFSGHGAWETTEQAALVARLHDGIAAPGPLPTARLITERRATFSCVADLPRCPQKTPCPGLFIAGDHTWKDYPATLEGAVKSGLAAARLCLLNPNNEKPSRYG
jgi:squalene-associated FAD-dependent desaturase